MLAEALVILVVITLGSSIASRDDPIKAVPVVRFKAASEQEQRQQSSPESDADTRSKIDPEPTPSRPSEPKDEVEPVKVPAETPAPQLIRISPREMAASDIAALPRPRPPATSTARPSMGPPDTSPGPRDSARVSGSGPNGEPLYAASWYREPSDDELGGYLSTATGPGWGLIACRTAQEYRVESCMALDEYPSNSNIARAVLAAAWQFRVRPPMVGGRPRIGEWVRIRIDYGRRNLR